MSAPARKLLALSLCLSGWLACNGSSGPGGTGSSSGNAGTTGAGGTTSGAAGTGSAGIGVAGATGQAGGGSPGVAGQGGTGVAGNGGSVGSTGGGGSNGVAGQGGTGASGTMGSGGSTGTAGSGGSTGTAGTGGADACGTPPWRALKVTATAALHTHGNYAALDGRAKSIGKLAVNLGVNGGSFATWLSKRGYHSMGTATFTECNAPNLSPPGGSRDAAGDCRINTEWKAIEADVTKNIKALAVSNPEEDWGYFLTQDGSAVRWSDVAFTGVSHGATTAAIIGRLAECVWRVVSNAGPRDNTCGKGMCNPTQPELSYDPACPDAKIGSWLDMPSKTPMDRFYGLDGISDVECGDILFNMERTKYPGKPVLFDSAGAVLTGTNRFISTNGGHLDFLNVDAAHKPMNTDAVLNIAFAIPAANQNPAF